MEVQQDYKELLELFNSHKVKYLIVGAYAMAFHGVPRYTGDIDILVKPDFKNAKQIIKALNAFGFGSTGLNESDFTAPDKVIQLGVPPCRIDILTTLTGISWKEAYSGREKGKYGNIPVCFIGKKEFIINKKSIGRKKDLADIEALGKK